MRGHLNWIKHNKMARIKGAKDLHKRKTRKDKGRRKKRVRLVKFRKVRGHKTHLKLYIWDITPMSRDGFHHWNRNIRLKVNRTVYGRTRWRIDAPVGEISSVELIENFMLNYIGYEGSFLAMGGSGSLRSKRGFKWVKVFSVKITEHPSGLRCKLTRNYRLFRYWFWRAK